MSKKYKTDHGTFVRGKNIGNGGSCSVFECHRSEDECNDLAIKILSLPEGTDATSKIERFKKEIEFQKSANNKYIVPCFYSGECNGELFYIMPRHEKTLRTLMNEESTDNQKIEWFLDLCEAIRFCHSKDVIHRDIKPENVMQGKKRLLLGDFGIAHYHDSELTEINDRVANFNYHAPEQIKNSGKQIGKGTDIYALGLILNELFTGALCTGTNPKKIADDSPTFGFLDDIVETMLINDIDEREEDVVNIINKVKFGVSRVEGEYEDWVGFIDIPGDISESDFEDTTKHVFEDMCLADRLLNSTGVNWNLIDARYHMNLGYSANDLLDTIIFIQIFDEVVRKFEYECSIYVNGADQFYTPMDWAGKDSEIIEEFYNLVRGLDTITSDDGRGFNHAKGRCLKYFQSLSNYHAEEVLNKIDDIKEHCTENLLDAPILCVAQYISCYVGFIKENLDLDYFELRYWLDINWDICSLDFEYNNLYTRDLTDEELINEGCVKDELKCRFPDTTLSLVDGKYMLYFTLDDWRRYVELCNSQIDESISERYVLNGDIRDLFTNCQHAGDHVLMKLNSFDFCTILPKILFEPI